MNEWFRYSLLSGVSLALLYSVYALFMRKDTFFSANRAYLILSLLFSALIPILDISRLFPSEKMTYFFVLETIQITPGEFSSMINSHITNFQVLLVAYLTGITIFLARFIVQLSQLGWLIKKYGITRTNGINMVFIHREYHPFSFFNLIFINAKNYQPEQLHEIIEHEKVHIRQNHTLDLLLLEIITILQWFNPFIWFYRRSLKELHEYLADEGVLLKGIKITEYQDMLLGQTMGVQLNDLTNNFNHSLLKRRFIMMNKQKSRFRARLKPLLALPVIFLMMLVFSMTGGNNLLGQDTPPAPPPPTEESDVPPPPPPAADQDQKVIKDVTETAEEETIFLQVAKQPEYKGGQEAFIKYIVENVRYPEEAKKKGTTGKVYVQFLVDENGRILHPEVLKPVDPMLDAEALRVISTMPDWNPGRDENGKPVKVAMTLPIHFSLEEKPSGK